MIGYENLHIKKPSICLVVGDVNSTMACAIVAKKEGVLVAHVEAGLDPMICGCQKKLTVWLQTQ